MLEGDKYALEPLSAHAGIPSASCATPRGTIRLRPSRGALLLGVIGAHAAALYLGLHLAMPRVEVPEPTPIEATLVSAVLPRTAPSLPTPNLIRVEVNVPLPDIDVMVETPSAITVPVQAPAAPAAQPAPAAPPLISQVAYITPPQPHYPSDSRRAHEQGTVMVRVLIDEMGHARKIAIDRSSGHPRLDAAALEAVSHALFRPYLDGGTPRPAIALIPVEFALSR